MQLRYLPNVISLLRLAAVPVLAWLAHNQAQQAFAWLILIAGLTDALDGWVARRYGWTSAIGALLDSVSDMSLILVAIYGIWMMQRHVFVDEWMVFAAVLGIWSVVHLTALLRYGRLASFHTRFTQLGIILFGTFVLILLFYEFVPLYFYFSAAVCFLSGVESLAMIIMIPEWTPDLREGLPAAIRHRRNLANK